MLRYAAQRLLQLPLTLLGVLILTFVLFDVVGGSPAAILLGKNASAEALAEYDRREGYDLPLLFGTSARLPGVSDSARDWGGSAGGSLPSALPYRLFSGRYRWRVHTAGSAARPAPTAEARVSQAGVVSTNLLAAAGTAARFSLRVEIPAEARLDSLVLHFSSAASPEITRSTLRRRVANPFNSRFFRYLANLARGDLGDSPVYGLPVARVLREGVGVSLSLTIPILFFGTAAALFLGLLCAARRGGILDRGVLALTTALMSVNYVIWVVAGQTLLSYRWGLFPLWGYESWFYLALPVTIGVISGLGRDVRYFRTVILDETGRPHVRTAIAKGLSPRAVLLRHVLRNSLVPIVTHISLAVPFLFTGSILLESFFGLPGIGGIGLNALNSSDVATVRAVVLIGALLYQLANLMADLAYAWLDPRVRIGS